MATAALGRRKVSDLKLKADYTTRASEVLGRRYCDEKQGLTNKYNRDIEEMKALYETGNSTLVHAKNRDINKLKTEILEYEWVAAVAQSETFYSKRTVKARYKQGMQELKQINEEQAEIIKTL